MFPNYGQLALFSIHAFTRVAYFYSAFAVNFEIELIFK